MQFKIRSLRPHVTPFTAVEADTLAEAAGDFLAENRAKALFVRPANAGRADGDTTYFAVLEVEGEGEFVARYFYGGIGRQGGIKPKNPNERDSIAAVERDLGLKPGDISDVEWVGEESPDHAWDRKMGRSPEMAP